MLIFSDIKSNLQTMNAPKYQNTSKNTKYTFTCMYTVSQQIIRYCCFVSDVAYSLQSDYQINVAE